MSRVLSPRDLVMNRLVRRVRSFPDLEIVPIVTEGLPARDASLAWAIDQAVARRWLSLVPMLQVHLERSWDRIEPGAKAALLTGSAQLVFMDRLPAYAVISEAVSWTKRRVRPKAGGLVNAVLRRVGEMVESATTRERGAEETQFARNELPMDDGRVLVYGRDVFAEDETQRLSEQTSHGVAIVSRWVERFGVEEASKLALHGVVQPPTIVTDVSAEALETRNERGEVALSPHAQPGFFVFRGDHMTLTTLLASSAACRVQDPTAAHAVKLAHDLTPGMVIDLCAGRGTKTRQLAAQFPDARIVASDASQERVKVLRQVFAGNERVTVAGPDELGALAAQADLVVCDVPCSNSGVLARRSEAKYRFDAVHLAELVRTQKAILSQAASLLKPGGAVLYATCSIEEEENAAQVKSASSKHGWRGTAEFGAMPAGLPGVDAAPYHDGGYAALLVSTG